MVATRGILVSATTLSNQDRAVSLVTVATQVRPPATGATPPAGTSAAPPSKSWFFNPWLDSLFIANLVWPLLLLAGLSGIGFATKPISFWMIYIIVTPHRWITLVLVFLDPDRFQQHSRTFLVLAAGAVLVCFGTFMIWGLTGVYVLLAVDFLWNSWHFASQHAGILRIYRRNAAGNGAGSGALEKLIVRAFVLFVLLRLASITLPLEERFGSHLYWLQQLSAQLAELDLPMLAVPIGLVIRELWRIRPVSYGRLTYMLSFSSVYGLLLAGVHGYYVTESDRSTALVMSLAVAVTVFHSSEYMAVVSWAAIRKRNPRGALGYLAPRWIATLVAFLAIFTLTSLLMDTWFAAVWLVINLMISFLHYAYDGIIWKARKPALKTA